MTDIRPQQKAIVLFPGDGERVPGPEGIVIKAGGPDTNGSVGFVEATSAPGFVAPPHIHHDCDEMFYVLEGEFEFVLGDGTVRAPAGSFVFIPRGTVHSPRVFGDRAGKVVFAFVPGGAEQFFLEMSQLPPGPDGKPDMALLQKISRERYNSEFV